MFYSHCTIVDMTCLQNIFFSQACHPARVDAVYHFGTVARPNPLILAALQPAGFYIISPRSRIYATVLTHGHTFVRQPHALEPRAGSVPNACAVSADQTAVHSRRFRHTCGHFLLPIRAIVAWAHLRLHTIRRILPRDMQEKGKYRSDSTIGVQSKPICMWIKAVSTPELGLQGANTPFCQTLLHLKHG